MLHVGGVEHETPVGLRSEARRGRRRPPRVPAFALAEARSNALHFPRAGSPPPRRRAGSTRVSTSPSRPPVSRGPDEHETTRELLGHARRGARAVAVRRRAACAADPRHHHRPREVRHDGGRPRGPRGRPTSRSARSSCPPETRSRSRCPAIPEHDVKHRLLDVDWSRYVLRGEKWQPENAPSVGAARLHRARRRALLRGRPQDDPSLGRRRGRSRIAAPRAGTFASGEITCSRSSRAHGYPPSPITTVEPTVFVASIDPALGRGRQAPSPPGSTCGASSAPRWVSRASSSPTSRTRSSSPRATRPERGHRRRPSHETRRRTGSTSGWRRRASSHDCISSLRARSTWPDGSSRASAPFAVGLHRVRDAVREALLIIGGGEALLLDRVRDVAISKSTAGIRAPTST